MEYFSGEPLNDLYVELLDEEGKEVDSTDYLARHHMLDQDLAHTFF